MKISILSENSTQGPAVTPEFGLSILIECAGKTVLFDSGSSGNFANNARAMGIDLSAVDYAVLSHGHFDHADGFEEFMRINDHAPIYVHEGYDGRYIKKGGMYIGVASALAGHERVSVLSETTEIAEGLTLLSYESANAVNPISDEDMLVETPAGALVPDDFSHEHYLLACEGDTRLLVTGCTHRGIANVMHWTRNLGVTHVTGGFHLMGMKPQEYGQLVDLAKGLLAYPVRYFTCHCTGIEQYARLKQEMGGRIAYAGTGWSTEL